MLVYGNVMQCVKQCVKQILAALCPSPGMLDAGYLRQPLTEDLRRGSQAITQPYPP